MDSKGGEPVGYFILETEARHLLAREVRPIVGDDGMRKAEVTHDIFPEELDNLLPCDDRERHCFHQLSEIVCGHQQESELRQRTGKRSYHIKPPLHERPGTPQSVKVCIGSV